MTTKKALDWLLLILFVAAVAWLASGTYGPVSRLFGPAR